MDYPGAMPRGGNGRGRPDFEHYLDGMSYDRVQEDDYGPGDLGPDYGGPQGGNHGRGGPAPRGGYPGPGPGGPMRGGPMPRGGPMRGGPMRGGPMPHGGPMRGGPMPRGGPRGGGPMPGPGRGFPPPGRGGRPAPPMAASSDPASNRPNDFGGSSYPTFPGHQRVNDLDEESRILDDMAAMEISGPPGRRPPQRGPTMDNYGGRRPSMESTRSAPRGMGGYPDPRHGPPPPNQGYGGGDGYYDDGYGAPMSPGRDEFGAPGRSMTMPNNVEPPMGMRNGPVPPRADSAPYNGFGGRMPARPSTASGHRPPPQRFYPNQPPPPGPPGPPAPPGPPQFDDGYDYQPPPQAWANESNVRASFGDFYDAYYRPRDSEQFGPPHDQFGPPHDQYGPPHDQYGPPHGQYGPPHDQYGPPQEQYGPPRDSRNDIPDFDAIAAENAHRASLDQHMQPGPPNMAQQSGPGRMPEMNRTKSQPNLRESQTAVFEMAPDVPPVPNGGFQPYNGQPPVGLPSGPASGLPAHPAPGPGSGHPAPIRPGLMANSLVSNMTDKPPPVRQYNGPPPAAIGAQGRPPPLPVQDSKPAAKNAFPVTPEELESLRTAVKANPNDQQTALTLAKKLVEAADVLVPRLPDPKTRGRARERYVLDAHKILKKLASAQNPDAMFYLADCLGRGALGLEADNKEAFTLYQSAAKLGHAGAAYRTAVCCEIGNDEGGGTRKDPLKAIQWYKRSATLGDTPAMYKVGMIMLKGLLGQQRNPREAVGWLKRAAERADEENPHALHELGLLYESAQPNDTILRDEAYAFSLFEQAANLGYKFSQYRMGCVYEYGLMGCPVDPRASIMWYSRAATQEEHQAELSLSGWYLTGSDGVLQQSDTEAYLWARKAAQAGLAKAEYAMGYFTETGIGVPANLEDAKRWYWRAAAQDFPKARERLEDLKRSGKNAPRPRERISRSKIERQQGQEGECSVM